MNTNTVTVYSKPKCPQCDATKRSLTKHGVAYTVVDITKDAAAREYVLGLGYTSAPVVVTPSGEHWASFRPDRCKALAASSSEQVA